MAKTNTPPAIDAAGLRPGDLLVLPDGSGRWADTLEDVGVDSEPGRIQVRRRADDGLYSVSARLVRALRLVPCENDAGAAPRDAAASPEPSTPGTITAAQRRTLFGLARRRRLEHDDLCALTPAGSVSKLSAAEAAALIDRLGGQADPPGDVTCRQRGMMAHLQRLLGWKDSELSAWLTKRFRVASFACVTDKAQVRRIIAGLVRMHSSIQAARQGGVARPHESERSGLGAAG